MLHRLAKINFTTSLISSVKNINLLSWHNINYICRNNMLPSFPLLQFENQFLTFWKQELESVKRFQLSLVHHVKGTGCITIQRDRH